MRIILIIAIFFFSCKNENENSTVCIDKIEYFSNANSFASTGVIGLTIKDINREISKKGRNLKDVIFYSVPKEDRQFFEKKEPFIVDKKYFEIPINTNYFNFYNTNSNYKKMTQVEILNFLSSKEIGLIFESDTLIVQKCLTK